MQAASPIRFRGMTPAAFVAGILLPGAAWTEQVCGQGSDRHAHQMLGTIALQESGLHSRFQRLGDGFVPGAAKGWWQFERGALQTILKDARWGIMLHPASAQKLRLACDAAGVDFTPDAIHRAVEGHDHLAYACARLLLLTDPDKIPTTPEAGWACYRDRTWKPGKPHVETWGPSWTRMEGALRGS